MWYGNNKLLLTKNLFYRNKKINFKIKSLSFDITYKKNLNYKNFYFYIPNFWNFFLLKHVDSSRLIFFFYSNNYNFLYPINYLNTNFFFDKQTNVIIFNFFFLNTFKILFFKLFKILFFSFNFFFFKKIKFRGKGYYMYKNFRNTIALQFGYSHKFRLYLFKVNLKFLNKTSILVFGINKIDTAEAYNDIKNVRLINIFTGKGIRFSKQIIYKKTGKVSSYR